MSLRPRLPVGPTSSARAGASVPSAADDPPPNPLPTRPPTPTSQDANYSMSLPSGPPDLPTGYPDPVPFASLIEDVSALRSAIAISRAREDSLVSRVEALEALVTTLRDSYLEPLAPTSTRKKPTVNDEEDEEEEEDIVYSSRKSYEPRGRVPNRHKVRMARGAESDESSASEADDGHPAMGDRVPKGRRVEGLVELTTRRPEFRPLVNYRSYRLANRSQTVDDHVTSKVNSYLKMMRHHVSEPFAGEPAIRVFDFLSAMRDAFNVNRISEGAAYLLLPHFLLGKAKHGVISRWKQVPSAMPRYPVAVQFLLQSYATPRVIASACQRVMSARQELNESEAQFGERLGKYAAEAGNVFNEDLLISVFLEGLQPFAAHSIRSRITDDMTFAQVQQEAEDAGLAGRAVASRTMVMPRAMPLQTPLARPRAPVATAELYASSDAIAYDDYMTPNTHPVMAVAAECATEPSPLGLFTDDGSDVSVPTRGWASAAGSAFEEPVMAVGDRTRTCYLCFSPDHYILGCPQLTTQQKEMAHQKRLAFSQIEKPFGSGDVPYGLNKPAGPGNKPHGLPPGQVNRSYGQPYGYSRPLASNRVYSDARPPFRRAVWEVPPGGGDRRNTETHGSPVNCVEAQEAPTETEPVGSVQMESENARRDA
jgi:hypothetical protein